MKNALVILAGGKGKRFGQKTPKQFYKIGNKSILDIFFSNLKSSQFEVIILSIDKKYRKKVKHSMLDKFKNYNIFFSEPGKSRQQSSYNALKKLNNFKITNVLIHDAVRPFCSNKLIEKILSKLNNKNNCIPYIQYNDRQIIKSNKLDTKALNIQTPQGFKFDLIYDAHKELKNYSFSDDASLLQQLKKKIYLLKGEKTNIKITYPDDLVYLNIFSKPKIKSGIGYDIHQINKRTKTGLKLCGVKIPFSKLIGHSDADVGLHAICDSIFGALSMRDIGYHFPNTNKKWKNVDSSIFVIYCREKLLNEGFKIINLDINIIAEKPKIGNYVEIMKNKIGKLLQINKSIISIKATTNEKIGFIGNGEGIAAEAVVQISDEYFY